MRSVGPILSIVIPALNEEGAIGSTIRRCLEARPALLSEVGLSDVEILVVSDGSTDRTEAIACSFEDVTVITFERNRGYGAAIKCGFELARGDLLGFIDADGTCDPHFFVDLCHALDREGADVALGSRMNAGSLMPRIRRLGNLIFALILGLLSRRIIGDTASGMRVLRRSCLLDLYPLPDGLHFTPAMTARVLLEGKLKLVEVPMPYAERVGGSKLSVVRDGFRFLISIIQAAMCYRPARPLLVVSFLGAVVSFWVGLEPTVFYLRHSRLEEWMIYRIMLTSLVATMVALLVSSAVVAERIAATAHDRPPSDRGITALISRLFTRRGRRLIGAFLVACALALTVRGIAEYATTGHVTIHWSRVMLASLLLVLAAALGTATFLLNMLDLIQMQRQGASGVHPPHRVRRASPAIGAKPFGSTDLGDDPA
ncbi:MAG TPA: glycosyltransferase family 2 protein [Myxococcota bacterium]|nr:glycosyltransferase family 2 protein [Myxococcota bacterium]